LYNEDGSVGGVITGDFGVGKNGEQLDTYTPGIAVKAKQTILTEGCRGSVSGKVMKNFRLDKGRLYTPSYCLGLKEVWEVDNEHFNPGEVMHTSLWPLTSKEYGGSFIYHMNPGQIHIGFVIGLSYENPYLNPYEEF
jgi:electron-transferring-flavoprotein dehydrogenase